MRQGNSRDRGKHSGKNRRQKSQYKRANGQTENVGRQTEKTLQEADMAGREVNVGGRGGKQTILNIPRSQNNEHRRKAEWQETSSKQAFNAEFQLAKCAWKKSGIPTYVDHSLMR